MTAPLKGRNFLALEDFTPEEINYLLDLAHEVKRERYEGGGADDCDKAQRECRTMLPGLAGMGWHRASFRRRGVFVARLRRVDGAIAAIFQYTGGLRARS